MIIDIFLFNNEIELLELRLRENWDLFDKFIIIEGNRTFQGKEKDSLLDKQIYKKRFEWANKKIIRRTAYLNADPSNQWENEIIQLDFMTKLIREYVSEDEENFFITGDCDEIVNKLAIKEIFKNKINLPLVLFLNNYYYYFNGKFEDIQRKIPGNIILKKENLHSNNIYELRKNRISKVSKYTSTNKIIAGWHFSFLGGADQIIKKIEEYSHSEYNNETFKNKLKIEKNIKDGEDIFNRTNGHPHFLGKKGKIQIVYTPIDNSYPEYILKNISKYKKYIKKPDLIKNFQIYSNLISDKDSIIENQDLEIIKLKNKKNMLKLTRHKLSQTKILLKKIFFRIKKIIKF